MKGERRVKRPRPPSLSTFLSSSLIPYPPKKVVGLSITVLMESFITKFEALCRLFQSETRQKKHWQSPSLLFLTTTTTTKGQRKDEDDSELLNSIKEFLSFVRPFPSSTHVSAFDFVMDVGFPSLLPPKHKPSSVSDPGSGGVGLGMEVTVTLASLCVMHHLLLRSRPCRDSFAEAPRLKAFVDKAVSLKPSSSLLFFEGEDLNLNLVSAFLRNLAARYGHEYPRYVVAVRELRRGSVAGTSVSDNRTARDVAMRQGEEEVRRVHELIQRSRCLMDKLVPRVGSPFPSYTNTYTSATAAATTLSNSESEDEEIVEWEDADEGLMNENVSSRTTTDYFLEMKTTTATAEEDTLKHEKNVERTLASRAPLGGGDGGVEIDLDLDLDETNDNKSTTRKQQKQRNEPSSWNPCVDDGEEFGFDDVLSSSSSENEENNRVTHRDREILRSYVEELVVIHMPRLVRWIRGLEHADDLRPKRQERQRQRRGIDTTNTTRPTTLVRMSESQKRRRKEILDLLSDCKAVASSVVESAKKLLPLHSPSSTTTTTRQRGNPLMQKSTTTSACVLHETHQQRNGPIHKRYHNSKSTRRLLTIKLSK